MFMRTSTAVKRLAEMYPDQVLKTYINERGYWWAQIIDRNTGGKIAKDGMLVQHNGSSRRGCIVNLYRQEKARERIPLTASRVKL